MSNEKPTLELTAFNLKEIAFAQFEEFFQSVIDQAALTPEQQSSLGEQLKSGVEKRDKLGNCLAWIDSQAEILKKKEQQLAARRRVFEKFSEIMKSSLHSQMVDMGIKKVEGNEFTFAIRTNPPRVEVEDEKQIPAEYFDYTPVPNKQKIKDDIGEGKEVPGAKLVQGTRLDIR